MYCNVCSGPFTSYQSWDLPNIESLDTTWLTEATIEYYATGQKVNVVYYDGYGRFEDKEGTEYDVVEAAYEKKVAVYHKLCKNRKVSSEHNLTMKRYQDQHFDIDKMIADGREALLDKPRT